MDLDFRGDRGLRIGWKGKGRQGGGEAPMCQKKSVMLVVYIYYASFSPHHYAKRKKERMKIFLFPHFPRKAIPSLILVHPSFFFLLLHKTKRKEKEKKVHLHLPQFPCLTFHFSTLSFNHPLIHLSCPSPNFECSIISPNRILKSK